MNSEIKELMLQAIQYPRPDRIQRVCSPVWNQPFFYKIDKARVLTISYNPTDKGARTNYKEEVERYKKYGYLDSEEIYDILYNFKKENYWRKYYDILFRAIGIHDENIAHMDVSFFPYNNLKDYMDNKYLDDTRKFLLKTIKLLENQLEYILVDGAKNQNIVSLLSKDYTIYDRTMLPINSGAPHDLLIYKHKSQPIKLIYYGCFLYGQTCPQDYFVNAMGKYIASKCTSI